MPQKRNPVPLEHLRLRLSLCNGECDKIINTMHNTPFADMNDSEREVQSEGHKAFSLMSKILPLLSGFVESIEINKKSVKNRIKSSMATITELADSLVVKKVTRSIKNETWKQVWGEQKNITDNHNELAIHLSSKTNQMQMIIRFRLFNDGLGFRYEIPEQNEMNDFKILDELTEFNFSEDSESWWIPAYAYRRFEFLYANTPISDISRDNSSD